MSRTRFQNIINESQLICQNEHVIAAGFGVKGLLSCWGPLCGKDIEYDVIFGKYFGAISFHIYLIAGDL